MSKACYFLDQNFLMNKNQEVQTANRTTPVHPYKTSILGKRQRISLWSLRGLPICVIITLFLGGTCGFLPV